MMLPFMLWEHWSGARIGWSASALAGIVYTAVLPSFVADLLFNRGVELVGADLAGQSMHLMPLFGTNLALAFLHQEVRVYHMSGIALIACGIMLASFQMIPRPASAVTRQMP